MAPQPTASSAKPDGGAHRVADPPCYAAIDLGTNNCRLLIATPSADGFRVVESFSRIVRLGDGLSRTGRLDDDAMDRAAALVVDVGGGSTELSWVDLSPDKAGRPKPIPPIGAWLSIPVGVVTLAERFPETPSASMVWFRSMVDHIKTELVAFTNAEPFQEVFQAGRGHLVGTSGAITSLAGMHLGLKRYDRSQVDGLWLTEEDCRAAADRLMAMGPDGRAAEPCIGPDRADLVLAGAAILQAVQELWPCPRVRVADRGLREGILLSMMAERRGGEPKRKRRRGRRRGGGRGVAVAGA
jgi:exopolyphosphatase/guanosine-5'-triphosphate,3'-diphosphate pyrophosphatase